MLIKYMQEPGGRYSSVLKATKQSPANRDHAFVRDDFSSLGLMGAYKLSGNHKYLDSVEKFLRFCYAEQQQDGSFDPSTASMAMVLNATFEADGLVDLSFIRDEQITLAFEDLSTNDNLYW